MKNNILVLAFLTIMIFSTDAFAVTIDGVPIPACNGENLSTAPGNFTLACTPSTITSNNGITQNQTFGRAGGIPLYGGINQTSYNASIIDCGKITSVEICYELWVSNSNGIGNCGISVDADGGASYTLVNATCPGTVVNPGVTCTNVTATEAWTCGSFFGPVGAKSLARTEVSKSSGATATNTLFIDHFNFRVSYDLVNFSSQYVAPTPADRSNVYPDTFIPVNVTANANVTNLTIGLYYLNGTFISGSSVASNESFVNFTGLALGSYIVNYTAQDAFGMTEFGQSRIISIDDTPPSIVNVFGIYTEQLPNRIDIITNVTPGSTPVEYVEVMINNLSSNSSYIGNNRWQATIFTALSPSTNYTVDILAVAYSSLNDTNQTNFSYTSSSSSGTGFDNYTFSNVFVQIIEPPPKTVIPFRGYFVLFDVTQTLDGNPHTLRCEFYSTYNLDFGTQVLVKTETYLMNQTTQRFKSLIETEIGFLDGAGIFHKDAPPTQRLTIICGLEDVKYAGYTQADYTVYYVTTFSYIMLTLTGIFILITAVLFFYSDYGILSSFLGLTLMLFTILSLGNDGVASAWFIEEIIYIIYFISNLLFLLSLFKIVFERRVDYLEQL